MSSATPSKPIQTNLISGALVITALLGSCALLWTTPASAQSSKAVTAEALFDQGRKLMQAGDYEHACPKFVESQHLDPASGTLLNLAVCYENLGRTATAWEMFKEAASVAVKDGHRDRVTFANEHIAKLEPNLSRVSVTVDPKARVDGLKVVVDGIPMNPASWGVLIPMDPGIHEIEATTPKHVKWKKKIKVEAKAGSQQVVIPPLAPLPNEPSQSAEPASTSSPSRGAVQADSGVQDMSGSGSSMAIWGYVAGGAGVVALGVGGYFGLAAMSKWDERKDHCEGTICDDTGVQIGQDATTYADVSTAGFAIGAVGLGVGAYLLLTAPSADETTERDGKLRVVPSVGKDSAALMLGGTW